MKNRILSVCGFAARTQNANFFRILGWVINHSECNNRARFK